MTLEKNTDRNQVFLYTVFWSVVFLISAPIGCIVSGEGSDIFYNLLLILTSPSKLVTDYFNIGGLGSTLLNTAACGIACNLITVFSRAKNNTHILPGYFLVVAHCFYGLNFINMWPPFIGVYVFCKVTKRNFAENLHIAMFSTALGPFISDFLFRYTLGDSFVFGSPKVTVAGIILALLFGLATGFIVPALLPGTTKMHRGFNLYKAGLAIGILGMFVYAFMYATLGIEAPDALTRDNPLYEQNGNSYQIFMTTMFGVLFVASIVAGFILNGNSFKGYRSLLRSTGHGVDFVKRYGAPLSFINIGIYGLFILLYLNVIFISPIGVEYTGPTAGVTIAAITFTASGQTPKNVWPIVVGYAILSGITFGICSLAGLEMTWSLASQGYINGLAFATGLCPFAGKYGWKIGIIAGVVNAIICTSTLALHGGFVLYNGGLTAGLTALILIPVLDYYNVKEKFTEPEALRQ
jgi:hypothetical protein